MSLLLLFTGAGTPPVVVDVPGTVTVELFAPSAAIELQAPRADLALQMPTVTIAISSREPGQ